jgi:hypothetical protein
MEAYKDAGSNLMAEKKKLGSVAKNLQRFDGYDFIESYFCLFILLWDAFVG